jgi:cyclophilin family peptidyl-prolyl cis-trans isomerase
MKNLFKLAVILSALVCMPVVCLSEVNNPRVVLETNLGNIVIELFSSQAPITVDNFLGYVNSGFYNYLLFHRVVPGFMIQGGAYYLDGYTIYFWPPDQPPIINESYNGLSNLRGTIAMARSSNPNSANSQFFINEVNNPFLDRANAADGFGYCVFGQVVEGMDTVDDINQVPTCYVSEDLANFPCDPPVIIYAAYALPCDSLDCSNFNSDEKVDFKDFAFFALQWMDSDCNSANDFCQQRDLDYNGTVNYKDLAIFADNWLWGKISADVDIDGDVDFIDYAYFASHWLQENCIASAWCAHTDFDKSGQVSMFDLEIFISNWLAEISVLQ